jgi:hypothetical protein
MICFTSQIPVFTSEIIKKNKGVEWEPRNFRRLKITSLKKIGKPELQYLRGALCFCKAVNAVKLISYFGEKGEG